MLARCCTYVLDGIAAHPVTVECDIRPGLPSLTILGLGDTAVRELADTVRVAVHNCGYRFPDGRITLNIAPARLRSTSPSLALAVAVAVLAAAGEIPADQIAGVAVYGALADSGWIAPLRGSLAAGAAHRSSGLPGPLLHPGPPLPAVLDQVNWRLVSHLAQIGSPASSPDAEPVPAPSPDLRSHADFADVRAADATIFALTVAAAGGHPVLLRGAPGSGATVLARRLASILPALTPEQEREVATIRDAAGLGFGVDRPFRAPHHTITPAGLVGGGAPVRPGEVTLAHRGVLFLSGLDQFARASLDALRAVLDNGSVTIVRGQRASRFPASFQVVASASPCPCGHAGTDRCTCDAATLARHRRRLSLALLERFPVVVDLPSAGFGEDAPQAPSSAELRDRVLAARERRSLHQLAPTIGNGSPASAAGSGYPVLTGDAWAALHDAYRVGSLSHRSGALLVSVAQTIAVLAGEDTVSVDSLNTALALGDRRVAPAPRLAC